MTRGELRALIRKRLGETTAAFWTDTELNQYIDNAGHDVANKTKCIKTDGYITTTSDGEYTVSDSFSNWLSILRVYLKKGGSTWIKLTQTDEDRLDRETDGWRSATASTPDNYYQDKERDILGLYPKADTDNQGTDYLRVYYAKDYTAVTLDSTDMADAGIPWELQMAMADFVVGTGYEQRGWGEKANDSMGKYVGRISYYMVQRDTEKQVDDEALVMKNYRNK